MKGSSLFYFISREGKVVSITDINRQRERSRLHSFADSSLYEVTSSRIFIRNNHCHRRNKLLIGLLWTLSREFEKTSYCVSNTGPCSPYPSRSTYFTTPIQQDHLGTENLQSINTYYTVIQNSGRFMNIFRRILALNFQLRHLSQPYTPIIPYPHSCGFTLYMYSTVTFGSFLH